MRPNFVGPANRGFTLIEMLMVISIVGIMMTVALTYFRTGTVKASVRGAADAVAALHSVARNSAIQRGRTARLVFIASSNTVLVVAIKASGSGLDTIGKVEDLGTRFGVTFTTTTDTLVFTPRGVSSNTSGTTVIISKGTARDTVTVSAAGKLAR